MSKNSVKSLSDAIAKLESASHSKTQQIKEHLEKDYSELLGALDDIKPYLEDVRKKVEEEAGNTKNEVEARVKDSPWITLGIVGLVAFFIGLFIGRQKK